MLFVHLVTAIVSDVLLMLTALTSILYLLQEHALKASKQVIALPSIQSIDLFGLRLLVTAFILMTIGIGAGSWMAYEQWGIYWYLDPRQLWSMANWALFAFVLLARFWVGWRGRRAVMTTLVGVTLVLVGFFVMHYLSWSQHV
ncbi:MAG: cytochrome c biogenesis protein CcsA [Deltaproteobacteria bacterium]|nr:cytochrome c biogenesis protein CcsA [Deltaproteobacteria bacterium]